MKLLKSIFFLTIGICSFLLINPAVASCGQLVVNIQGVGLKENQSFRMSAIQIENGTHERSEGNINLITPNQREAHAWLGVNTLGIKIKATFHYELIENNIKKGHITLLTEQRFTDDFVWEVGYRIISVENVRSYINKVECRLYQGDPAQIVAQIGPINN